MLLKLAIFFSFFLVGDYAASLFDPNAGVQIEQFSIGRTGMVLEVHKTHAHQFLAEYDFKLILKTGSKEIDSKDMTGDSGGLSRIDVMRISKSQYAFRDHGRTVCLNIDERKLNPECDLSGIRVGHLDFDSSKRWRYISEVDGDIEFGQ